MTTKVILKNWLSPGDVTMLTAAVRDLHHHYPGRFLTDVRTPCPDLWENNPRLTPLRREDPDVDWIDCEYPLVQDSNRCGCHFLHGFIGFLNTRLNLDIRLTAFKGDIHLSDEERHSRSQVADMVGEEIPYWIVVAGGKRDATIKWWDIGRFQEVVDHFRGRIQFVQVGQLGHYHPPLNGVIDLRAGTTLRGLIRLIHHAQGVLCPVTCAMHLAAAVDTKAGAPSNRPCVVVAGGREPSHWEAYPNHQYLHTIGALSCCAKGGCWRSRTEPLGDGARQDGEDHLCLDRMGSLPRCMDMITPRKVIESIQLYFNGGLLQYLGKRQGTVASAALPPSDPHPGPQTRLDRYNLRTASDHFLRSLGDYPGGLKGRGIVICAGGIRFLTCAWVCINMLRRVGCRLPIQLWHRNASEMDASMRKLLAPLGVECVDAEQVQRRHPVRKLGGWGLKPYAILHAPFQEVLLLDADNVPVRNPEVLFGTPQFLETGAVFWPDRECWEPNAPVWEITGVPFRNERCFESGQVLVDKQKCWQALKLAMWYNEQFDFFYQLVYGDKDTFRLAFRKVGARWAIPSRGPTISKETFFQYDFQGRRMFQHRCGNKWNLFMNHEKVPGFRDEDACLEFLRELRTRWPAGMDRVRSARAQNGGDTLHAHFRSRASQPLKIRPVMMSCPQREAVRRETLRSFEESDLADESLLIRVDDRIGPPRETQIHNTERLLRESLAEPYDYLLFLEDDLEFNRHLKHNLLSWPLLQRREAALATLFNPGLPSAACDPGNDAFVVDPEKFRGSLALVLSRPSVRYLLEHWHAEEGPQDTRIAALIGRLHEPIFVHVPSLVEHMGKQSTWGSPYIRAANFNPSWKR